MRGRSAAGFCALGVRSSWHVGIRLEGKSGHLERVDVVGSRQKVLRWLLAVQLDCKKDGRDGEIYRCSKGPKSRKDEGSVLRTN
jgi:hypothetical protein